MIPHIAIWKIIDLILREVEYVEFGLHGPQHDCKIFSLYLSNKAALKNRELLINNSLKVSAERFAFTTESICNAYNTTCISVMRWNKWKFSEYKWDKGKCQI